MNILSLRPELFHPLFVHFPIALTVLCFLTFVGSFFSSNDWWKISSRAFLYVSLMLIGLALFTGDFAEDAVKKFLCDRHEFREHEEHAYQTLYILILALLLDMAMLWSEKKKPSLKKYFKALLLFVLAASNISLAITGHHGANMVYEQGAAVKNITVDCSKFPAQAPLKEKEED